MLMPIKEIGGEPHRTAAGSARLTPRKRLPHTEKLPDYAGKHPGLSAQQRDPARTGL
jgi:hypothetical protein